MLVELIMGIIACGLNPDRTLSSLAEHFGRIAPASFSKGRMGIAPVFQRRKLLEVAAIIPPSASSITITTPSILAPLWITLV
jgi:hypothetical protein